MGQSLEKTRFHSLSIPHQSAFTEAVPATEPSASCFQPPALPSNLADSSQKKIAQAIASLLSPMITAAVESAIHNGIEQLRKELVEHSHRLSEKEQRISFLEDELQQAFTIQCLINLQGLLNLY